MFRDEQEFNQAIERLHIDAQPRPAHRDALRAKMLQIFEQAQIQEPSQPVTIRLRTWLWRPIMNRTFQRIAGIAAILIVSLGTFTWWSTHHAGVAFAQVVEAVQRVQYCSFTMTITSDGTPPQTMRMMIREGTRLRQETAGTINIIDLEHGKFLALVPAQKLAVQGDLAGLPEDAREKWDDYSAYLKKMLTKAEKVEDLGFREVAGKNAQGFRITKDGQVGTVWVDPDSGLPLESIQTIEGAGTRVCTDFDFRPPVDGSLFDVNLPPGYTMAPVSFNLNVQDSGERDLIEMLRVWTGVTGGQFPDSLSMSAQHIRDALEPLQDEIGMLEGVQIANAIARGAVFLAYAHDPHYVGAGVQLGQADKPVFWHKPKNAELYHVVYGDLSVREMPADQLPKVGRPAPVPARSAAARATPAGAAPAVIETVPAKDALDVDPATEIRITFDQDMRPRGCIHLESGEPDSHWSNELNPVWLDARTFRVPARLKGHSLYVIRVSQWGNTMQFPKSATGQVAQPWQMEFTTGPAAGEPALTLEQNRAAVETLRDTLRKEYPHILNGFDLSGQVAQHTSQLESCKGRSTFAVLLQKMLSGLRAPRVQIWYSKSQSLWPSESGTSANMSWNLLPKLVPNWQQRNEHDNAVLSGLFPDNIGYILLNTWQDQQSDPNKTTVLRTITELAGNKGLILDLRPSGGAPIRTIEALASRFIDHPVLYARETPRTTNAVATGEPARELRLEPSTTAPHVAARLAVLIGPGTTGMSEQLALMLKQARGCMLIGQKTAGTFGSNESLDLGNGVRVMLPKYSMTLPDGADVADGVRPDIEVKASRADFDAGHDPVLEAALKVLRQ